MSNMTPISMMQVCPNYTARIGPAGTPSPSSFDHPTFVPWPCPRLATYCTERLLPALTEVQHSTVMLLAHGDFSSFFAAVRNRFSLREQLPLYEAAWYLQNNDQGLFTSYLSTLNKLNRYQEAHAILSEIPAEHMDAHMRNCLAVALNGMGRFEEALDVLAKDVTTRGRHTKYAVMTSARTLKGLRRFQDALDLLHQLPSYHWDRYMYFLASGLLSLMGRLKEAYAIIVDNLPPCEWDDEIRNRLEKIRFFMGKTQPSAVDEPHSSSH